MIKRKLEQNYRIKSNQIEDELNAKRFTIYLWNKKWKRYRQ